MEKIKTPSDDRYKRVSHIEKGIYVPARALMIHHDMTKEELLVFSVLHYYIKHGRMNYTWITDESLAPIINMTPNECRDAINSLADKQMITRKVQDNTGARIIYV